MTEKTLKASIEIRRGTQQDVEELVSLADKADRKRLDLLSGVQPRKAESFKKALARINDSDFWVRVAVLNGEIVGFISGEPTISLETKEKIGSSEHIKTLIVDPNMWGRGIGKTLVDTSLDLIREKGRTIVELWTHEINKRAQGLYEGRGFKLTGEKKKSEDTNELIVHYIKEL